MRRKKNAALWDALLSFPKAKGQHVISINAMLKVVHTKRNKQECAESMGQKLNENAVALKDAQT